jgi:hypothetical protein
METDKNSTWVQIECIVKSLIAISSRDYQLMTWYRNEGDKSDDYEERAQNFEADIDYFKDLLRKMKIQMEPVQIRAVLRVHVMILHFDEILSQESLPTEHSRLQLYIIEHPYWMKIRKQATDALSLLKVNAKDLSNFASNLSTEGRLRKLDGSIKDAMSIFGDRDTRERTWKNIDDFWMSAINYNKMARKFFNGFGCLSSGQHLKAFMAFHKALDELCVFYENDSTVGVEQILSDPRFHEVEEKARDFLAVAEKAGSGHRDSPETS